MKKTLDIVSVTDRLRLLCSRREYAVSDIMKKAETALDGNREQAAEVVRMLIDENYVDDFRYSCAYARDKASIAGWGRTKIRYMLVAKGVARDVIDRALEEVDESKADARMEKLMRNKYRTLKTDPQVRVKMLRFALGRGYLYEDASRVTDIIINEGEDRL